MQSRYIVKLSFFVHISFCSLAPANHFVAMLLECISLERQNFLLPAITSYEHSQTRRYVRRVRPSQNESE